MKNSMIVSILSFLFGTVAHAALPPSVVVGAGTVVGTTTTLPSSTALVNKFLGIPYAQPPVGDKRFLPPQSLKSFVETPLNATVWSSKCLQYKIIDDGIAESEDCLFLNVFAPAAVGCSRSGRPVLVWIHGGWLREGTASQPMFDGSSFASQQGIVVVTFNYRLNVFGFPNSEQLPLRAQNLGFLDQRLALEWVQANIHAFGGDPAKVTIAGESSGGSSVDRLVTTIHTNQSFRAAALSSGQATVSAIGRDAGPLSWAALVSILGCRGEDEAACVRGIDASTVQKVVSDHGLDFSPVNDNFTQMELPYLPTRAAGGLAPVPILIGSTGQEGTYLAPAYNLDIPNFTEPVLVQFLNGLTGGDSESVGGMLQVIQLVQQASGISLFHAAAQVYTEIVYQCPNLLISQTSAQSGIPTWRYYYNASFPNLAAGGYTSEQLGASHGSDTRMIWGTYPREGATDRQISLSRYLQTIWAGFVKDPLRNGPGWEKVDVDGNDIACIGCVGSETMTLIDSATVDGRCAFYAPFFDKVKTPFLKV
ncbi:Putative carboxylesterase, type B, carboxylesterase type B, carboxylesterase type B, active [Colletotrichum destructivum]|uniref:Carboxylic ester hydrolase n=1 Tax=Colletotrichum destructivum TaxID=34406 RepID=A0AAX4IBA4_9PEZI|nr:Putative carboxylesterase, type B, carboxylesterase type B, carboxylesterase type B, active [Colletotrichum destructivum]